MQETSTMSNLVCDKCGYPLSEEISKDPPDRCPHCLLSHRQARGKQKWVDADVREAEKDAARAKKNPTPKPLPEGLNIAFIGDEIHDGKMDWSTGKVHTSKSQRAKEYKESGMNMYSAREHQKMHPSTGADPGKSISYAGQKDHRSSSERGSSIKTADGRTVV